MDKNTLTFELIFLCEPSNKISNYRELKIVRDMRKKKEKEDERFKAHYE